MENKFQTKQDFLNGFSKLMDPLKAKYSDNGRLDLGTSGSVYGKNTQEIEAFLRPLWAFGPFLVEHDDQFLNDAYVSGIINGTDPESAHYWGDTKDYDQLLVEMAALSTTLLLSKEKTWEKMSKTQQDNLAKWLDSINHHKTPKNNWLFFRVLVNLALKECAGKWNPNQVEADFKVIESFYIDNGWSFDGVDSQMDYYISFAIHYYSLIYAKFMAEEDPERCTLFKERATMFAQTFQYWFDEKGEALPFGRSLTYRFAQCSFWSALVFCDVEALPWGEIKGIISCNMSQWFSHDIFNASGFLSVGYHYENLVMAEGYNAPGSPYWALKSFILLAVPDNHPYWQAEPVAKKETGELHLLPEARMVISDSQNQIQSFVGGQLEAYQAHIDAKYSKLVYSSKFGFSVSKGSLYYTQGGFDNCLALSENDLYYRSKLTTTSYEILADRVINVWQPWDDVTIKSTVIPLGQGWHIRVHDIETARQLNAVEGGFAVPFTDDNTIKITEEMVRCENTIGITQMQAIKGFDEAKMIRMEPNTNLFFQCSNHPSLKATDLMPGTHRLVSLVGGFEASEEVSFTVELTGDTLNVAGAVTCEFTL